jgi:cytochrome P450
VSADAIHRVGEIPEELREDPWLGANPFDPEHKVHPWPSLARLREIAPVHRNPLGNWRLSRYADCVRLLRDVKCGVRHLDGRTPNQARGVDTGPGNFMLQQDPPNHTRLRKIVGKAFTPRTTERMRPHVESIVGELLERAADAREMEVISELALAVPSTVICEMMGIPLADRGLFTDWTSDTTHILAASTLSPEKLEQCTASAMKLAEYCTALIEERSESLGDDLVSTLIRAHDEGSRLSSEELLAQTVGLLIAGFETTIGLIGNGVRQLLLHPDELERLRAAPGLIEMAVEECLRFDGPIAGTLRVLHEDAEFSGVAVPADSVVFVEILGANRDPAVFPDPERFDIARDPNPHLGFGGGTHQCLGMHLARMETQVALGGLVSRMRRIELVSDEVVMGTSLFRVLAELPIRVEPN